MRSILLPTLIVLLLSGCASSPKSTYYRLTSKPIPAMNEASNQKRVMIGPVTVPVNIDRPQLVIQRGGSQVEIFEYHRWAASLKGDVGQVIAASLASNMNMPNVWNFSESTQTQFDYQVFVDVQTLEAVPGQDLLLDVHWSIKPSVQVASKVTSATGSTAPPLKTIMGRTLIREPTGSNGFEDLIAAQSAAFEKVGKDIASKLVREN